MPVLIHPVLVGPAPRAAKFGLAQVAQYTFDTTLGIGSLLMSGVLDRFPRLKLVLSHGGGAYPYLAGRFDIMHRRMDRAAQGDVAAKLPSAYAAQMAYDSIVHAPKALRFLIDVVGLDNVALGTDYSFPPADMEPLALLRSAGLGGRDRRDRRCQSAPCLRASQVMMSDGRRSQAGWPPAGSGARSGASRIRRWWPATDGSPATCRRRAGCASCAARTLWPDHVSRRPSVRPSLRPPISPRSSRSGPCCTSSTTC